LQRFEARRENDNQHGGCKPLEMAFIVTNHFLVELVCYTLIACVMSTAAISRKYLSAKAWLDRFAAIVMAGLGLRLLFQR
ncbi:MAG: hypothetical protein AAFN43_07175, partial [Pseudomonadota bacterium]